MAPKTNTSRLIRSLLLTAVLAPANMNLCSGQSNRTDNTAVDTSATSDETNQPPRADLDRWIADLNGDQYAVREQASRKLKEAGRSALVHLAKAADAHDAEASTRAVAILDAWARNEQSALHRDALELLAVLKRHPAAKKRAQKQLSRYAERNAIAQLTRLGARITEQYFLHDRAELVPLKMVVGGEWKGTDDDLAQLRHLRTVHTVAIYSPRVGAKGIGPMIKMASLAKIKLYGTDVEFDDLAKLKAAMPHVEFDVRRGALLGIGGRIGGGPAVVDRVQPDTAAQRAGLQPGDVIREIDGKAVATFTFLTLEIAKFKPGSQATLTIQRAGKELTKTVEFGRWR